MQDGGTVAKNERYAGTAEQETQEGKTMARHNEVTLYGQVAKPPVLLRKPQNDPDLSLIHI